MNKKLIAAGASICLALILAACSSAVNAPAAGAGVPTLAAGPTGAGAAAVTVVVTVNAPQVQPAGGAAVSQAPLCQAAASCAALNAEQIPLECVKKVPYTNVLVPKGTTFEVLDKTGHFSCVDTGVVTNGEQVITCHGQELYAFQLKLSNTACGGQSLATGTGQCQEGYGYDSAAQCCAPVTTDNSGATVVTVNLGGCPLPKP